MKILAILIIVSSLFRFLINWVILYYLQKTFSDIPPALMFAIIIYIPFVILSIMTGIFLYNASFHAKKAIVNDTSFQDFFSQLKTGMILLAISTGMISGLAIIGTLLFFGVIIL